MAAQADGLLQMEKELILLDIRYLALSWVRADELLLTLTHDHLIIPPRARSVSQ